ncbi:MAG: ABC transporter permease [Desulfovibrio sp.]|jgi:putative ABC transport system permease protein|nr:ABC transporter permease [Desulfovibrio sp.]
MTTPPKERATRRMPFLAAFLSRRGNLRIALRALSTHRLRTVLAILGVFLGAFMLTLVLHISQAVGLKVTNESNRLGANVADVTAGTVVMTRGDNNRAGGRNAATLTLDDARAIERGVPRVELVVPYAMSTRPVAKGRRNTSCPVVGAGAAFREMRNMEMLYGSFFREEDVASKALVCVPGYEIAARLFDEPARALGQRLRFGSRELLVVGVMAQKGQDATGVNVDEQIYVPVTTFMERLTTQEHVSGILLRVASRDAVPGVQAAVTTLLRARHHLAPGQADDFGVAFSEQVNEMQAKAMELVRLLGAIGAGISFSIGTLGILSIMTIIVRARRLEIGVRRAVGATKRNIVAQFLFESVLMAGTGGLLGVGVALGIASAVYAAGVLPTAYDPPLAVGVLLASAGCGLMAGAYPAWQAARVDVIRTLRG